MLKIVNRLLAAVMLFGATLPSAAVAADRVVTLSPTSRFFQTIRLGTATGGPELRAVVPPDIAAVVFTDKSDNEPVAGWFDRTFKASLKKNDMLAKKPELAKYELSATVQSMAVTPIATGSHHKSSVAYRLTEIATGAVVWEGVKSPDFDIARGMRFGALGGALGAAAGGALTGQNPAVTAAMINSSQRGRRPFDIRIDTYEGIMRGFQDMAEHVVIDVSDLPQ